MMDAKNKENMTGIIEPAEKEETHGTTHKEKVCNEATAWNENMNVRIGVTYNMKCEEMLRGG